MKAINQRLSVAMFILFIRQNIYIIVDQQTKQKFDDIFNCNPRGCILFVVPKQ